MKRLEKTLAPSPGYPGYVKAIRFAGIFAEEHSNYQSCFSRFPKYRSHSPQELSRDSSRCSESRRSGRISERFAFLVLLEEHIELPVNKLLGGQFQ